MTNYEINLPFSNNAEIILSFKKNENYPEKIKYAIVGRVKEENKLREIIRIDNSYHEGKKGTHIHYFDDQERVVFRDFKNQDEAIEYVREYLTKKYWDLIKW